MLRCDPEICSGSELALRFFCSAGFQKLRGSQGKQGLGTPLIVHQRFSKNGSVGQYHVHAETEFEARTIAREKHKGFSHYEIVKVEARY